MKVSCIPAKPVLQRSFIQQTDHSVVWTEGQQTDRVESYSRGQQTNRKMVLYASHKTETDRVETHANSVQTMKVYHSRDVNQQTHCMPDRHTMGFQTEKYSERQEAALQTATDTCHQGSQVQELSQLPQIAIAPAVESTDFATSMTQFLADQRRFQTPPQLLPTAPPMDNANEVHDTGIQVGKGEMCRERKGKTVRAATQPLIHHTTVREVQQHSIQCVRAAMRHDENNGDDTDLNLSDLDSPKK